MSSDNLNYYSSNNCIISISDQTLILGCKNSIIPTSNVVTIGTYAFAGQSGLKEIIIPKNISTIKQGAFTYFFETEATGLERIDIPDTVTFLGQDAFGGCDKLKEVTIGKGIESLEDSVFWDCSSLERVKLGENIKTIKSGAFAYCYSLREITIPEKVSTIFASSSIFEPSSFEGCDNLTDIYLPGHTEGSIEGAPWGAVNATIHWNEEAPE